MDTKNKILKILEQNPTLSNREIGKLINLSRGGVQYYMNILNIHRDRIQQQKLNNTCREKKLFISNTAEQIILGSIIGDGSIMKYYRPENTKLLLNSCLCMTHGKKQLKYLEYKKQLLEKEGIKCYLSKKKIQLKKHYIKGREVKDYGSYYLKTMRNVIFNRYRDMFYHEKKFINRYIFKLNALGLAIWYMDDGCFSGNSIHLYTNCFSRKDDELLVKMLKHNFDLEATLQKSSNIGWIIYIKACSRQKFLDIVRPYITESMRYKIGS